MVHVFVLGNRKNILSASLVSSFHDLQNEVSHDRGADKSYRLKLSQISKKCVLKVTLKRVRT